MLPQIFLILLVVLFDQIIKINNCMCGEWGDCLMVSETCGAKKIIALNALDLNSQFVAIAASMFTNCWRRTVQITVVCRFVIAFFLAEIAFQIGQFHIIMIVIIG